MLNERTQSHTARRCLSYTPRRPCDPEPDNSWIHECPCGQKLPCTPHGNLWRELRYTKPWDPDYAAALKCHNIPIDIPACLQALSSQTLSNPNSSSSSNFINTGLQSGVLPQSGPATVSTVSGEPS